MEIAAKKVVRIEYTLKNDKGEVLDSSEGREPLAYLHGVGNIVPGLEKALDGKKGGDEIEVSLSPAEGYGSRDDKLVRKIPLRKLGGARVQVGGRFPAQMPDGPQLVTVTAISGDYATVDPNHPLADQTLHFKVKVIDVRDPTAEELAHNHVHGEGGHDH